MAVAQSHQMVKLDKELKKHLSLLKELNSHEENIKELLKQIQKPVWPTPSELTLVVGIVENVNTQLESLIALRQSLINGSWQLPIE